MIRQPEPAEVIELHPQRKLFVDPPQPEHEPFSSLVDRQLTACRRYDAGLAVLFIHMDGLLGVGERHGTALQRTLLDTAWQRLQKRVRSVDMITRIGDDTFGAALFDVGDRAVGAIEARLFDELSAPYRVGSLVVELTAVTGSAVFPGGGAVATDLVRRAAQASRAKGA